MAVSGPGSFSPSLSSLRTIPISPETQSRTLSIPGSVYTSQEEATPPNESEHLRSAGSSPSPSKWQPEHGSLFNLAKSRQNRSLQERALKQAAESEYIKVKMTAHQVLSTSAIDLDPPISLDEVNAVFFQNAKDFLQKGNQDKALIYLNEILSVYPKFYPALEMRIIISYNKRRFDSVISDYNQIEAHMRSLEVLKVHLKTMFEEEYYAHALLDIQSILDREPDDPDAQKYQGAICLQLKQIDKAREYLLAARNRDSEDHFTLLWLARMYSYLDNDGAASIFVDPLLESYPLDPQVLLVKAMILIKQGCLSKAKYFLSQIESSQRNKEYARLLEQIAKLKEEKANSSCHCIIC